MANQVDVIRTRTGAHVPIRATSRAIGYDCNIGKSVFVKARSSAHIPLGFKINIPSTDYDLENIGITLKLRSGVAKLYPFVHLYEGLIDAGGD